jgi:SAM-dependent methyltransferase
MNSFTSEWLALREPVDHRSRNPKLLSLVTDHLKHIEFSRPGAIHIVDLGCGSGSNLRALAPAFNAVQEWTLVDSDPTLLLAAHTALMKWGDDSTLVQNDRHESAQQLTSTKLIISKNNKKILVNFECADLSKEVHLPIMAKADLVTAAAFFDLTSASWLQKFCANLSKPLYASLSYNGVESWEPSGPSDQAVLDAFHFHQRTDKGFGAAAGPTAASLLVSYLKDRHFHVDVADSPWVMNELDRSLIDQLALGTAAAVNETGILPIETIEQWVQSKKTAIRCVVGHTDVFACP